MTRLLQNDVSYEFGEECKYAFNVLKERLVTAPLIRPPEWGMPIELMCDVSGYTVGALLGQKVGKERLSYTMPRRLLMLPKAITPP